MILASSPDLLIGSPAAELGALAAAAGLVDAAERLMDAATLGELWPLVAEEALALIPADGTAIVEYRKRSWSPLAVRTRGGASTDQVMAGVDAAHRHGLLADLGVADDGASPAWVNGCGSVLVTGLDRRPSRVITRLLWWAERPDVLADSAELADLVKRQASLAVRAVGTRESLRPAIDARNRVGQAQGILMARHGLTAEQVFALLVRRSQHTNTKLRAIAEEIILTGRLDGLDS